MPPVTRLDAFLDQTGIKPAVLAREANYSRQHLLRIRKGTAEPTRAAMVAIANACSRRLERRVRVQELFDLGDDDATTPIPPPLVIVSEGTRWLPRLRRAVRATGKTQTEIARRAGVREETVSRVLTGDSVNPQLETIVAIAHAAGCTLGWLLDERGFTLSTDDVRRLGDVVTVILNVTGLNPLMLNREPLPATRQPSSGK